MWTFIARPLHSSNKEWERQLIFVKVKLIVPKRLWFLSTLTQLRHSSVSQSSRHLQTQINFLAQQNFTKANHLSHFLTSNVVSHLQIQSEILSWLEFFLNHAPWFLTQRHFRKMKPCQKLLSLKTMSKIIFKKSSKILSSKLFKLLLRKRCQSIWKFSLFPKIFGFNVVITLALHFVWLSARTITLLRFYRAGFPGIFLESQLCHYAMYITLYSTLNPCLKKGSITESLSVECFCPETWLILWTATLKWLCTPRHGSVFSSIHLIMPKWISPQIVPLQG